MLIDVTEILRCPQPHDEAYLICGPVTMDGRHVVRGGLACPVCRAEYPIVDRVAWFAPPDAVAEPSTPSAPLAASSLTVEAVRTFLDLQGGGGYVLLVGNAARFGPELAALLPLSAVVCCCLSSSRPDPGAITVLHSPRVLPIKRHSVRAVVVGSDAARDPWLPSAVEALLTGLRVIVEDETAAPAGVVELARGAGVFVGEKRTR
jgi:uncharacterized protein YbaR (Trm112 family)